jgi:hypothetical protein
VDEPRRPRLYLDTSAYLCVLLREAGWDAVARQTNAAQLLSSVLLVLEAKRNLIRLTREGTLSAEAYRSSIDQFEQDIVHFMLRDLTRDLSNSLVFPAVATPRSLDLIHLQTALWFHTVEPIDRFVTVDTSQQQAAKELGLPV